MFKHLKLGPKFTLILSIVFVGGIVASGFVLWAGLQGRAEAEVTAKGELLINMMKAVRTYTSTQVNPLLKDQLAASPTFIQQSVPAFSARTVFDKFRTDPAYSTFFYKEAAPNPTAPEDKADDFEAAVVAHMESQPGLKSLSGFRMRDNEWVYYTAWPLAVSSESCLICHTDPAQAPKSLLATYGSENGFGWKLHDIVAAQMLYVPAEEVLGAARRSFVSVMAIFVGVLAVVLVLINFLLSRDVIRPLAVMADLANKIRADEMVADDLKSTSLVSIAARFDELGQLASTFRQMASEVYARTLHLKQEVQELRIEVDEAKRQQHVQQVVETEFFQKLQEQARALRSQREQQKDKDQGPRKDGPSEDS
jgi:HAMP domain-containing protein